MLPEITLPRAGRAEQRKRGWPLRKSANLYRSLSLAQQMQQGFAEVHRRIDDTNERIDDTHRRLDDLQAQIGDVRSDVRELQSIHLGTADAEAGVD